MNRADFLKLTEFVASTEDDLDNYNNEETHASESGLFTTIIDFGDTLYLENDTHKIINECGVKYLYKKPKSNMKIKGLKTSNFANLYGQVEVSFDENITYLVGKNGAGKSTIGITAIWAALQGVAEKSKTALIGERFRFIGNNGLSTGIELLLHDEVKNVDITVIRRITKSGNELSFKAPEGYPVDKEWLDNLFNVFLLAPKRFIDLSSKQQAEALGLDTNEIDNEIKALKSEYTLINRDLTNLGHLVPVEKTERVDVAVLTAEKNEIIKFNDAQKEKQKAIDKYQEAVDQLERDSVELSNQIEEKQKLIKELQDQIAAISAKKVDISKRVASGNTLIKNMPQPESIKETTEVDNKIINASSTNEKAFNYEKYLENLKKKERIEKQLKINKETQAEKFEERTNYIKNQKLPFDNLTINEDGELLLSGKPIKEPYFSTGELLKRVPVLMASRNPELKYVFLQDFNLLDEGMQAEVEQALVSRGMQLVIELVGTKPVEGKNCILLRDCKVIDSAESENAKVIL